MFLTIILPNAILLAFTVGFIWLLVRLLRRHPRRL
jgi:hypothetical protein